MSYPKVAVVIPARLKSERLSDKLLREINGKSIIQRVYENVIKVYNREDVYIAAGAPEVYDHAKTFNANVVLTDASLPSGTDRIAAALREIDPDGSKYDIIVNFQGDGVNVDPQVNNALIDLMIKTDADITTVAKKITDKKEINDPAFVKIAMGIKDGEKTGRCLYFSRQPIPYNRKLEDTPEAFWHIGIYVYKTKSLAKFVSLPVGVLEATEKLEQLRALENGMNIFAMVVDDIKLVPEAPADINTAEEYEEAKKYIR